MWLKIFSSFLAVFIIFVLSFLTFFSNSDSNVSYYSQFKIPQNWLFSILKSKTWDFIESEEKKNSQILLERFDFIDKVFFNTKWSYTKKQLWNATSFKIWKWKFLLSLSFPKKYEVSWSWFNLNFVWPIKLYINTENIDKVDIFSFDNMVELTLLWLDDSKEKTRVYTYPHMLLTFNMRLNKILKNSDLFRISQLNDINYVNQSLYASNYKLDSFVNLDNYFYKSVLSYFTNEYNTSKTDDFILEKSFDSLSYDYIKKYFYIFVNDNKKISYYKDLIYMNLLKIYMSPEINNNIFIETEDYYKNLKILSQKDYNEMLKVLVYFKSKFLIDNKIAIIETELKYDKLLSTIFSFQKMDWNYMLYYIFNLYDLWNKNNFFDWLISFSDSYFKLNWLKIQEDKLLWYDDSKNLKLGYYISFLENIIKSHLVDNANFDDITWIFNIFNKYALLNASVYSNWNTDKKKTTIIIHLNLLKELSEYIRKNFFEEELDKWIILVKKKWLNLDFATVSLFEKSYNILYDFFVYNKKVFDENSENDYLYLKDYEFISFNFTEYISALKNYDKYKLEKSELYSIKTVWLWDDEKKVTYNLDDIISYFSNFNWVDKDSIKVKTDETWNTFSVNLNIGGKDFSFSLYPYKNYSINNIYIDWVKKNITYSLNLIKEKMDERYKTASKPEEKNQNDFNNFFINTFLKTKVFNQTNNNNNTEELPKEDIEILVFKRDKLLWPKWEFNSIKDFTNIQSDNINVNITDWKISIKLKDLKATFTYTEWRESYTYWTYIDSDYSIWKDEHYFNNVKLKLFKSNPSWNRNNENYWLWNDKYISVIWNIWIVPFKEYINTLVGYYNYIIFVNDALVKKVWETEISVNSSKIVKFTFKFKWKDFELSLLNSSVINIKRDWEKILQTTFNYTDLPNRINLLIK